MFYSFNLSNDRSLSLILNGSLLYSVEDKAKKLEFDLNDKERFVLEFLVENSSREFPSSPRDIEAAYKDYYQGEFGLYALKNTIASLRKKYKHLVAEYSGSMEDKELIVNVFKKGYYVDLDLIVNNQIKESIVANFNSYKPSNLEMLWLFLKIYHLTVLNRATKALSLAGFVIALLYVFQIWHLSSIVGKYSYNTDQVAQALMTLGCHDRETVTAFNRSLNLDSALLLAESQSCLVDRDVVKTLSREQVEEFLGLPQFVYTIRENLPSGSAVIGRISASAIENRYRNNLWPVLIDAVAINNKVSNVFTTGSQSGIRVFSATFDNGTSVAFYSHNLLSEWLSLFVVFLVGFYGNRLLRFGKFCHDWATLRYKLEKIIDTTCKTVLYHEVLTRVKHRTALQYIANLTQNQLVTFHTVLIAKTIANARAHGVVGVYGMNLCPSSLLNKNFYALEKYLQILEPNEVVLELTENSNQPYSKEIYANITHLKSLGFHIALDDFGTGNNNVQIVQRVSPDYLKVDKEFIRGIESNEVKKKLLMTLSDIGTMSDCKIIQEGVETIEQQEILCKLGYRFQQGYLYS
ncbi:EAL domain-containing protein [Vibrio coralliilyticus]|nr:EAL domain-containing protein [Vibrio coralliilyticus]